MHEVSILGPDPVLCSTEFTGPKFSKAEAVTKVLAYKSFFLWSQAEQAVAFTEWGYGYGSSDIGVHSLLPSRNPNERYIQERDNVTTLPKFQWHWEGLTVDTPRRE